MRRVVVCLAAALALAACGRQTPAAAPGPTVTLEQSRDNENRHLLQVVVTAGTAPVMVRGLQLRGGGFVQVPPTPRDDVVEAGTRTAFPIPYGEALCEGRPAPVVMLVDTPAGRLEVEVADDTLLPRLRARECALGTLQRTASFALEGLQRSGQQVTGALLVRRTAGASTVTVSSAEGSVIFTLRPGALPAILTSTQVVIPVTLSAARCDAHALTESKRTYSFPVYASLDGGKPLYLLVTPDEAGIALLGGLLREQCGALSGG